MRQSADSVDEVSFRLGFQFLRERRKTFRSLRGLSRRKTLNSRDGDGGILFILRFLSIDGVRLARLSLSFVDELLIPSVVDEEVLLRETFKASHETKSELLIGRENQNALGLLSWL